MSEIQKTDLPIRKFRVLDGTHIENKKTYTKGKIVRSTRNLAALFVNKFVEVAQPAVEEDADGTDKRKTASTKASSKE